MRQCAPSHRPTDSRTRAPLPRRTSPQPLLGSVPWHGRPAVCACPPGSSLSHRGSGGLWERPCVRLPGSQQTARRILVQHLPWPSRRGGHWWPGRGSCVCSPSVTCQEQEHLPREGRPVPTDGPQARCCPLSPERPPLGRQSTERGWAGKMGQLVVWVILPGGLKVPSWPSCVLPRERPPASPCGHQPPSPTAPQGGHEDVTYPHHPSQSPRASRVLSPPVMLKADLE